MLERDIPYHRMSDEQQNIIEWRRKRRALVIYGISLSEQPLHKLKSWFLGRGQTLAADGKQSKILFPFASVCGLCGFFFCCVFVFCLFVLFGVCFLFFFLY